MSGFGTVNTIKKKKADEDEEEDTNKYYVGGNDDRGGGSGQQVLAPNKDKDKENKDLFAKLLEKAKQDGKDRPIEDGEEVVEIVVYRNGFQVGSGPFRPRDNNGPNDIFLRTMENGDCPEELLTGNRQVPAIRLNDKSKEDYKPPAYTAFSGAGNTIGGSRLEVERTDVIEIEGTTEKPEVNEAEKTVRVQIKYPSGKRQVVKFNLHHVVSDLISIVRVSGHVNSAFVLQDVKRKVVPRSAFSSTITEAGLANAVVLVITKI